MITYELAKQLKDAGFPQRDKPRPFLINHETGERPYTPVLDQLVEACGEDFIILGKWAHKRTDKCNFYAEAKNFSGVMRSKGSTPEEAVARLYLALHKK